MECMTKFRGYYHQEQINWIKLNSDISNENIIHPRRLTSNEIEEFGLGRWVVGKYPRLTSEVANNTKWDREILIVPKLYD